MVTLVVRTDEHVADSAPQSRTDDYLETCLDKLRQIGDIAREEDADAVIDNGDTFHNKSARENSHLMVSKMIDLHQNDYPCPVYQNPGNHDFPYKNVEYVRKQPLQVLFSCGAFDRLDDVTIDRGDTTVRLCGIPYKSDPSPSDFEIERGEEDVLVACAHCYASMEGGDMFGSEPILSYRDLAPKEPDVFVFGHWHIDQGVQRVDGKPFINLGSMTRGSLTEDNLERIPRVAVVKAKGPDVEVETRELDVEPAEEVFDLESRREMEREQRDMEEFMNTLSRQAETSDSDDIDNFIDELEYDEAVLSAMKRYLRQVREETG